MISIAVVGCFVFGPILYLFWRDSRARRRRFYFNAMEVAENLWNFYRPPGPVGEPLVPDVLMRARELNERDNDGGGGAIPIFIPEVSKINFCVKIVIVKSEKNF